VQIRAVATGRRLDRKASRGAPPKPPGRHGPTFEITWDRARQLLRSRRDQDRGETATGQLDLFAAAAAIPT